MARLLSVVLPSILLAAGCASTGSSSLTVADALSKGGKQLTASEVKSLFSGATVEGQSNETRNSLPRVLQPGRKIQRCCHQV